MGIPVVVPQTLDRQLYQVLTDIARRAVDSGVNPIQIVVQVNVTGNDIKIITGGNGVILPTRNGLHYGRLILENPDSNGNIDLSVDQIS